MSLTLKIILGMTFGFITGTVINLFSLDNNFYINTYFINGIFDIVGSIFISSLKLMVVPLVFFSLSTGIASFDKEKKISVIALKTLLLYLFTTALAISLGLLIAIFLSPGSGLDLITTSQFIAPEAPSLKSVLIDIFPTNPIQAMAEGKMLQIIVFSIFFGIALRLTKDINNNLFEIMQNITNVIMKMVFILINFAPIGVFCLLTSLFAVQGINVLGDLVGYFFIVIFVLLFHGLIVYPSLLYIFTRIKPLWFYGKLRPLMVFAFSTSSLSKFSPLIN